MLKVVGASWLQTRISTYILLFVALLGLGALLIGEYGHKTKKDGTYAATVSWNHRGGYRIDFWGQGNDLKTVPLRAARAYYKTGIYESGWSIIEIETSAKFPDTVQAYAAGLLEGSLTWQLIHHHWDNTVNVFCQKQPDECKTIKQYLRDNKETIFERAELLESTDPFWHMVRLFYSQLNGLETGWKFAVRRSRQSVEMETEDFLWLALAANLPNLNTIWNANSSNVVNNGMIFLKALERVDEAPLIAIGHNTAAPYVKMLRLLKRYKFHYHLLPASKTAALIPAQSLVMSSYPGALSSHDDFYLIQEKNRELVVASTPLYLTNRSSWNLVIPKDQVMSAVRIMAANRLATDGKSWSRTLAFQNSGTLLPRQWVTYEPRTTKVWLTEQSSGITHAADYTKEFLEAGFLLCTGSPHFPELQETVQLTRMNHKEEGKNDTNIPTEVSKDLKNFHITRMQKNLTTMEHVRRLMRGYSQEVPATVDNNNNDNSYNSTMSIDDDNIDNNKTNNSIEIQYPIPGADDISQILSHRGDLTNVPSPVGVIDTKIIVADVDGLETFEATSGPVVSIKHGPFAWSKTFPDIQHIGHPDSFNFRSVTPLWVWK